ncbi:MAG: hypothetical protein NTW14_04110 [bacterium]|nr:hypothetical protein [bacterium]
MAGDDTKAFSTCPSRDGCFFAFRTVLNVTGDITAAMYVAKSEGDRSFEWIEEEGVQV